jgi:integrase/recombinase XerD
LDTRFAACDEEERLWFEFFLCTGMREQEVMHTYCSDVNLGHATVKVTHKPDRGWTPKAYKEREIPMAEKLVGLLRAWKEKPSKVGKPCRLVFPTAGCNPKRDFLDCLKAVAERAKLNKEDFWLHKFGQRSRRGHCGRAWIYAQCHRGWVIRIWNQRCAIFGPTEASRCGIR